MLNFRPFKDFFEDRIKRSRQNNSVDSIGLENSNDPDVIFRLTDNGYDYIDSSRISELETGVFDEYNDQYLELFKG